MDTVSIVYPLKQDSRYDVSKIPLLSISGQVREDSTNSSLKVLNVSVCIERRPMPLNTKIYGIDLSIGEKVNGFIPEAISIYTKNVHNS